jgi:predicted transcriptional regulator
LSYQLAYFLKTTPLGRRTLVQCTGLTESVVRTELGKLEAQEFVRFAKAGTTLTPTGKTHFEELFRRVPRIEELDLAELKLDRFNRAAQIRRGGVALQTWRLRDLAVREGATGALFLIQREKHLCLVDEARPLAHHNGRDASLLQAHFSDLQAGDLLVIVFAPNRATAGAGLWRILSEIVPIGERSHA